MEVMYGIIHQREEYSVRVPRDLQTHLFAAWIAEAGYLIGNSYKFPPDDPRQPDTWLSIQRIRNWEKRYDGNM